MAEHRVSNLGAVTGAPNLLKVVIHEPDWVPPLVALCAGFEAQEWRSEAFAAEIFGWLPSFALPWSEQQQSLDENTAVKLLRRAAHAVYKTDKYKLRGEFGELILHGILRQEFGTTAGVSKFWFKDAQNDTVKGFDVVHITDDEETGLQLWLGEAKFYSDLTRAIRDVATEIEEHLKKEYLRSEFILVSNKIDPNAPFADRLRQLLDENTSLDDVFSVLHIPVLLTYNSEALSKHSSHCEAYFTDLNAEAMAAWNKFAAKVAVDDVVLHLILVPLWKKETLLQLLHERLQAWQKI